MFSLVVFKYKDSKNREQEDENGKLDERCTVVQILTKKFIGLDIFFLKKVSINFSDLLMT